MFATAEMLIAHAPIVLAGIPAQAKDAHADVHAASKFSGDGETCSPKLL